MEDYKEKYEQAMLRMNKWVEGSEITDPKEVAEFVFPELKESEDERMRRKLIEALKECGFTHFNDDFTVQEAISWLEKQGEQKSVVTPKFKVGDTIRPKGSMAEYTIESISGECYHGKGWGLYISCDDDYELVKQKPDWSEEDEKMLHKISQCVYDNVVNIGTVNKVRYIDWLKSIKERVRPQTKQEWSEEDEENINTLSKIICDSQVSAKIANKLSDWLKSLKERYTWKPSGLPHWKKSTLSDNNTTGFNSENFCYKGYYINYREIFEKLPKDN